MHTQGPQRDSLSPLDGRYSDMVSPIRSACSERALVNYRVKVECEYLMALVKQLGLIAEEDQQALKALFNTLHFSPMSSIVDRVFDLEKRTRHDVKAVELAIGECLEKNEFKHLIPFVHFGLTSQDVTSVALWIQLRKARTVILDGHATLVKRLYSFYSKHQNTVMLSRTHGQPASPTTLGKEMMVFAERLARARKTLEATQIRTKFGGATGGFNAHAAAYPNINWPRFADAFLQDAFDMERAQFTTQIDHYDGMAEIFDNVKRLNTILIDLCCDVWQYVSLGYFVQKPATKDAVGSSTMPHKVNPIQFENAEGNLVISNGLLETLSRKLPISRMQRDLTDSTITRNIGVAFGHSFLAICNVEAGLASLHVNTRAVVRDLEGHWDIVTEGLQTMLRAEGHVEAYDWLKEFAHRQVEQNGRVTEGGVRRFVERVIRPDPVKQGEVIVGFKEVVSEKTKQRMLNLTPLNYTTQMPSCDIEGKLLEGIY